MAKVLVSFEDELLLELDNRARRRNVSRSAYLSSLVRKEIRQEEPEERARRIDEALAELQQIYARHAGEDPRPAVEIIREMRDSR